MANLFWKTPQGVKALLSTPFKTEDEFERMVFETSELLEDIFLLKRQIRGGSKSGIPDIVGIDSDGNVCILEMKNSSVDSSVIPQVLQYAGVRLILRSKLGKMTVNEECPELLPAIA